MILKEPSTTCKSAIGVLSRYWHDYPFDTFSYYINEYFNIELQIEYLNDDYFHDQEWKYLLLIYIHMKKYFDAQSDVYEMKIEWKDALVIQELIINLLSIPSMERFMNKERKNPYYRWIWDFY